jgi:ABC-type dipeptide/oligopeptide/nickel transport system permease component
MSCNLQRRLGIDVPWYEQYVRNLGNLARLDLGPTTTFPGRSVNSILKEQGPVTLELAGGRARHRPRRRGRGLARAGLDRAITASTVLMTAVPVFLLATLAIYVLVVKLGLFPTSGWHGLRSWLLPSLVLALLPLAQVARVLRFEMVRSSGTSSPRRARRVCGGRAS